VTTESSVAAPFTQKSSVWVQLTAVVVACILLSRLIVIIDAPDVWLDEAMLMANLPLGSLADAFRPLPHYGQAAPPGYLLLASAISSILGEQQHHGLRLLSLTGSLGAMVFMALSMLRLGARWSLPIALALVFLSPFGVRYGIEIKQYSFEFMATSLMVYATIRAAERFGRAEGLILTCAAVFAVLLSFAAPLIIGGMTAALALTRLRRPLTWSALRSVIAMAALSAVAGVWHLTVVAQITAHNFAYWGHHYTAAYLNLPVIGSGVGVGPRGFLRIMFGMFDPFYELQSTHHASDGVTVAALALLLVGLVAGLRDMPIVVLSCAAILGGIVVLSAAGLYPVIYTRHFSFVQPVVGIVLALGLVSMARHLARMARIADAERAGKMATALVVAASAAVGLWASTDQDKTHITQALAAISAEAGTDAVVVVSPITAIQLPFIPVSQLHLRFLSMDSATAHPGPMQVWLLESFVFDSDLPRIEDRLQALGVRYGLCHQAHIFGSHDDLGFTMTFRCGP
jgi:hypothetical protein